MAEPKILEEVEVPETVVSFPQQQQAALPPPAAPAPTPRNLAQVYAGIATVLAARLQCLLLVLAIMVLGAAAVFFPTQERLAGAGGFIVLALVGLVILGRRQ